MGKKSRNDVTKSPYAEFFETIISQSLENNPESMIMFSVTEDGLMMNNYQMSIDHMRAIKESIEEEILLGTINECFQEFLAEFIKCNKESDDEELNEDDEELNDIE